MIAVVGGTGNTGRALVKLLKDKGIDFKCVVRNPEKARETLGEGVALVEGDLAKPESLAPAFAGADELFLLSGHSPALEKEQCAAIDAAKAAGVKHVVKVSGAELGIRPDSPAPILRMHYAIEEYLKASGLAWTILRPNYFMQNLMVMAPVIAGESKVVTPVPGDAAINMIDVRDTAEVALRVLTEDGHEGKTYALNGNTVNYKAVTEALSRGLGREIALVNVPKDAAIGVMKERGMPDWLIDHMSKIIDAQANGGMTGDGKLLRDLLGHAPRTLDDFIADHKAAFGG